METDKLAIVIPAYKIYYFERALASIANQTCQDFTLYIGDDNSTHNLSPIVENFSTKINIVYKKFSQNIGEKDLVAQWERCIDLVRDEEWIWLFGDDDIMDPECVENFYKTIKANPGFSVYHFDICAIDQLDNILDTNEYGKFPDVMKAEEFLIAKLQGNILSAVVEYIFRKSSFMESGRFVNFDLAWASDDALWIKLAINNGIKNIPDSKIYWRTSPYSITPNKDIKFLKRKHLARIEFGKWVLEFIKKSQLSIDQQEVKRLIENNIINGMKSEIRTLSFATLKNMALEYHTAFSLKNLYFKITTFYLFKIYRFGVRLLKQYVLKI